MNVRRHAHGSPTIGSDTCVAWTWILTVFDDLVFPVGRKDGREKAICSGPYTVEIPHLGKLILDLPHLRPGGIGVFYAETETRDYQVGQVLTVTGTGQTACGRSKQCCHNFEPGIFQHTYVTRHGLSHVGHDDALASAAGGETGSDKVHVTKEFRPLLIREPVLCVIVRWVGRSWIRMEE